LHAHDINQLPPAKLPEHSGPKAVASLVWRQDGLGNRGDGQRREAILEILPPGHSLKRIRRVLARLLVIDVPPNKSPRL
jgi:hypothetical protein